VTFVKICGITNLEDAEVALRAGADLLGFILYPKSPRYVEPAQMQGILRDVRLKIEDWRPTPFSQMATGSTPSLQSSTFTPPRFVGVFVNEPAARIKEILAATGLDYAQLHGDEPPAALAALEGVAYKALRPADHAQALAEAGAYALHGPAAGPRWLIDAYDPHAYGGTGKRADWTTAAQLARQYPGLLLAGGLTPDNVAAAVAAVRPWGVDVASGVEAEPGRKDHRKVESFVTSVRMIMVD
jgi:phosphoribosylanthranilate isomerase